MKLIESDLNIMREFLLLALKTKTSPDFDLHKLPEAGRLDLVCRVISNSLCIANSIRRDTTVLVALGGPNAPPKVISFTGQTLRGMEPDEISIATLIQNALKQGLNLVLNESLEVSPGLTVSKKSFEALIEEKAHSGSQILYLHPEGTDIRNFAFSDNIICVFGDYIGLPRKTEKLLDRLGAQRVTLGPVILFASHCPIILHNEIDRRINTAKSPSSYYPEDFNAENEESDDKFV